MYVKRVSVHAKALETESNCILPTCCFMVSLCLVWGDTSTTHVESACVRFQWITEQEISCCIKI